MRPHSIRPAAHDLRPNVKARLVDPVSGKDSEYGKEGELWIKGPSVMLGYHGKPKETAETIVEDGCTLTRSTC